MSARITFQAILGSQVANAAVALLAEHWELVKLWNRKTNLTGISDDTEAAYEHYLDSLATLEELRPGSILDVGSGAGYPGVPLAIVTSEPVTLLEPRSKRVSFLRHVKAKLGLSNLAIHQGRSTDPPFAAFGNVVTRATFSRRSDLVACASWLAPQGRIIALRTEPGDPPAPRIVPYTIREKKRVLEVWAGPDLSGP